MNFKLLLLGLVAVFCSTFYSCKVDKQESEIENVEFSPQISFNHDSFLRGKENASRRQKLVPNTKLSSLSD